MSNNPEHDKEVYDRAIDYMNKAQKIYESVYFGHLPPQVTVTLNNLALCNRRLGNHEEARKVYKRILAIRIDTLGENHTNVAMVYRNLGTLEYADNKIDLALDYYEKSLKIFEAFGEEHLETALSLENMALVKIALENWDEAHYYFNKAGEILHRTGRMNHSLPSINAVMADHYLTNDREPDAYKLFQRLVGTSIAQPRDYAALEYFDRQLPENERPTRPYEHTTEYALEKWPDNEMLLRNKIVSLSESGDIDKMMEYLNKAKSCSVDVYLSAYSSFVEKGHIAIAMPILKEGLEHYPQNQ
ncbi:TPR repeat-containing DDB_G0287407-like, partial [Paramuricea clavata]